MNKGGTVEAAGIRFTMVHADHTGGATLGTGADQVTRDLGCWGWVIEFEDGTTVYHSGDTDLFGDMSLVRERHQPRDRRAADRRPLHDGPARCRPWRSTSSAPRPSSRSTTARSRSWPARPTSCASTTSVEVVELEPGETWEAQP